MKIFVAGNMDGLAKDIAMGEGEVLSALADIMEVPQDKRNAFFDSLQNNFGTIYNDDAVTNNDVVDHILKIAG